MSKETTVYKEIILMLLSLGNTAREIGPTLGLSGRTIEKYVDELKKTHKAKNITHLVAIALRNKIIK